MSVLDHAERTGSQIFVSYVKEDLERVRSLVVEPLRAAGYEVFFSRDDMPLGARWRTVIRGAVESGGAFVACFSWASVEKQRSYMNEELNLASEILRQMPQDRAWLIPVKLDPGCPIPPISIGSGMTLADIHWLDCSAGNEASGLRALIRAL